MSLTFRYKLMAIVCIVAGSASGGISSVYAQSSVTQFVLNPSIDKAHRNEKAIKALPENVRAKGVLVVGGETTLPPYLYKASGDKITGLEADFMQALEQALDVKIRVIDTGFGSMVIGLTSGRFDVAMSDFSDTLAREKQVNFIDYTKTGQILVVAGGNPKNISDKNDLCGVSAGGPLGSLSLSIAKKKAKTCVAAGKPTVEVRSYPTAAATTLALRTGRLDAMGIDYAIASVIVKKSNGKAKMVGHLFARGYHGAAVKKGNKGMKKALLIALKGIFKQGIDNQILEYWGVPQMKVPAPVVNAMSRQGPPK